MADVDIRFKGSAIASMNSSGTKTLHTSGKYCEGDIIVEYTHQEKPTQSKTVTPTASGFTVNPDNGNVLSSVVINGDANLVAGNVRRGVSIFGVDGSMDEGITPSGTKQITANGNGIDVTNYASVDVNVPLPNCQVLDITLSSDTTDKQTPLANISGTQAFSHRTDTYLSARLYPLFEVVGDGMLLFTTNNQYNGLNGNGSGSRRMNGTEAMVGSVGSFTSSLYPANNGQITIDSSGNVRIGCSATVPLKAGTWRIIFTW